MENKAIIFDLDNTLVDRYRSLHTFSDKFFARFVNENFSKDQLFLDILAADGGGYREKNEMFDELEYKLNWKYKPTFQEFRDFWYDEFPRSSELMNGALEVLKEFKKRGFKIGLITNGKSKSQNIKIDSVQIRDFFDSIHISEEVGFKKPNKEIFLMSITELDVEAINSFYVGDHPINDVLGAISVGLNAIWLEGFHILDNSVQIKTFKRIKKLDELLNVLLIT